MESNNAPKTLADLENSTASLRDSFAVDSHAAEIHLDALHITNAESEKVDIQLDFSDRGSVTIKEDQQLNYWRWFLRLVTVARVGAISALIVFVIYQYSYQSMLPSAQSPRIQSVIDAVHNGYKTFLGYLGGAQEYRKWTQLSLTTNDAQMQLENVLLSPLSIIDKKYVLQSAVNNLLQKYTQQQDMLA
jgi:hypothetical protein